MVNLTLVTVPIADLRREPKPHSGEYHKDPLQESQLLFNELVHVLEDRGEWLKVEAFQQKKLDQNGDWRGYPGWVQKYQVRPISIPPVYDLVIQELWTLLYADFECQQILHQLSFGTKLKGIEEFDTLWSVHLPDGKIGYLKKEALHKLPAKPIVSMALRINLIESAKRFLNSPYLWGGRSAFHPNNSTQITSVDCSGFTSLVYASHGFQIPRDAHDQYSMCQKIEYPKLKKGDLVFLATLNHPERMNHVMLFNEGDVLLESTMEVNAVRITTGEEKVGAPLSSLKNGQATSKYHVYFGSIILDPAVNSGH